MDDGTLPGLLREASAEVNRAQARRLALAAEWDRRQACVGGPVAGAADPGWWVQLAGV